MAFAVQVTMDAADPAELGGFWAEALGYIEQPPPGDHDSWDSFLDEAGVPEDQRDVAYAIIDPDGAGPRIFFQKVPEPKSVKNRVHLDVNVADRGVRPAERNDQVESEVERIVALGAERLETFDRGDDEYWVVLADPEGNEFCVQ